MKMMIWANIAKRKKQQGAEDLPKVSDAQILEMYSGWIENLIQNSTVKQMVEKWNIKKKAKEDKRAYVERLALIQGKIGLDNYKV